MAVVQVRPGVYQSQEQADIAAQYRAPTLAQQYATSQQWSDALMAGAVDPNGWRAQLNDPNALWQNYQNAMGTGTGSTYTYNPALSPSRTDPNSVGYNQYFAQSQAGTNPFGGLASQFQATSPVVPPMMTAVPPPAVPATDGSSMLRTLGTAPLQEPGVPKAGTGTVQPLNAASGMNSVGSTESWPRPFDIPGYVPPWIGGGSNLRGREEGDTGSYGGPGFSIGIGFGGRPPSLPPPTTTTPTGTVDTRSRTGDAGSTGIRNQEDGGLYNPLTDPVFYGGVAADLFGRLGGLGGGTATGGTGGVSATGDRDRSGTGGQVGYGGQTWLNPYAGRPMDAQPGMELLRILSTLAGPYAQNNMNQFSNVTGSLWNFLQDPSSSPQGLFNQGFNSPGSPFQNLQQSPINNQMLDLMRALGPYWGQQGQNINALGSSGFLNNAIGQGAQQGLGTLSGLYQNILMNGLPNQRAIEGIVPGQLGTANQLLGGNGQYGANDLLSQIMQLGLPNQRRIENLTAGQTAFGQGQQGAAANIMGQLGQGQGLAQTGLSGDVENQLRSLIQGGGISPEYAAAARQLILQPSQERLQGQLNRQGGGVAQVPGLTESGTMGQAGSGLFEELMRRNERDFNNQLIMAGQQNLGNYLSQAGQQGAQGFNQGLNLAGLLGQQGQQGIGNALAGFQGVAGAAQPYVGMAQGGGNQAIQNALAAFGIVPQSVAPFSGQQQNMLNMLLGNQNQTTALTQGLAMQPGQQYQSSQNNLLNALMGVYGQNLGATQNLGQLFNQAGLGGLGALTSATGTTVPQDYNYQLQQQIRSAVGDEAWGRILATLTQAGLGMAGG